MAVFTCNFYSKARYGMQPFTAILPVDPPPAGPDPGAYESGPWPALYLLHGYTGNHTDWLHHSNIISWAMKHRCAVIMPAGGNGFFLDNDDTKERYGGYIGEELVEVTRRVFPLSHKRADTMIGGLSMGGFGAIRNGLYYADTFGAILGLSSALITDRVAELTPGHTEGMIAPYGYYTHTFGRLDALLGSDKDPKHLAKERVKDGNMPLLFLACGTEDFLIKENLDYHNFLAAIGYPHEWWTQPGVHDFEFWNKSLPAGLDWLKAQREARADT